MPARVHVRVDVTVDGAVPFYESFGWSRVDERTLTLQAGNVLDLVVLVGPPPPT